MKLLTSLIANKFILLFLLTTISYSQQDTFNSDKSDTSFVMSKSPLTAMIWSAVLPGAGQIYNESYIKAPLIWGAMGLLIYGWFYNNDKYIENRDLFSQTQTDIYRQYRIFYRDQRDLFTIYLCLVYLLNIVDAYVDAHLFDFTVEENFLIKTPMVKVRFNF